MPTYVLLGNFTDQGAKSIGGTVERSRQVRSQIEARGGKVRAVYWTMGPYDLTVLVDFPDDETALARLFQFVAAGNVRTTTMRAFSESEVEAALKQLS